MRRAATNDVPLLVELMADLYAEAAFELNRERASKAFSDPDVPGRQMLALALAAPTHETESVKPANGI